jgi:O-antigen/teichoic acid export membrane protein
MFDASGHPRLKNRNKYINSAAARVLSVFSQFLLLAVIGSVASLSATGIYGACYSIAATAAIVGSFGQVASAFREIPALRAQGRSREIELVVNRALMIAVLGMVAIFLPVLTIAGFSLGTVELALLCFLFTVGTGFLNIYSAIARSIGWIFLAEFSKNGLWRIVSVAVLLVMWWIRDVLEYSPGFIVLVTSVACAGAMLLCVLHLLVHERLKPGLLPVSQLRSGIRIDGQNWLVQVMQAVLLNMDVVFAGMVLEPPQLGVYFILTRLASLVALPLSVTNPVIIPVISLFAKGEYSAELAGRVALNAKLNTAGALTLLALLSILFGQVFGVLADGENGSGYLPAFLLLALAQLSNSVVGPSTMACQLFNVRNTALLLISMAVLGQTVLVLTLGARAGVIGVAMAVFLSRTILNASVFMLILRKGQFNLFTGRLQNTSG